MTRPPTLSAGLLAQAAGRGRLLLCLDFDGTLSPIVETPHEARPLPGVRAVLRALSAKAPRVSVAVVSGRSVAQLRRLLGPAAGLYLVGTHGVELVGPRGGRRRLADVGAARPELARLRAWLRSNVPPRAGFLVEDKGWSIALHYRKADPQAAAALCRSFKRFVARETPALRLSAGKMVVEAVARAANKGAALRALRRLVGADATAVYFGDDMTDEDAFGAVGPRGISVLVGERAPTRARFRVDGPGAVLQLLKKLNASLGRPASRSRGRNVRARAKQAVQAAAAVCGCGGRAKTSDRAG